MTDWPSYLMSFAQLAATKSKDSTQVGAAVGEDRFYVYAHFEADTGRLFYVGKGSGRRAWSRSSRNRHWRFVASAHDFTVIIVKSGLAEDAAFALEAEIISACKPGSLATYTSGGGGISGYRHSDESRAAMSAARIGRSMSDYAKRRMSEVIRSRPDLLELRRAMFASELNPAKSEAGRAAIRARMITTNPMVRQDVRERMAAAKRDRTLSPEHRARVGDALRGRKRGPVLPHVAAVLAAIREKRKRPVVTACGLRFESTLAAAKALGVRQGSIANNCAGRQRTAGGYSWSYADARG